ncbi:MULTISPECIES: PEP/pyruvate-binding domain-containing protein [Mycobacterium]|uniref:Phosphoenolpyruvate synthase n=1 Tax=Mycobacterium kiyosense TaxID=2871094 RepID=A0A9P3UWJ6_9MYCO|nr:MULTISPECIES: PEP/pyruvate-binding domain-containing protein [Mycobacterium]BDE15949.1 phosphoenolpyruvate synthase [Mycobacterium sp. 20KCMC460]GLB81782.1 phosphoenolpyruvate synthase [Mycobacterium kiyosense]GLB90354.1 phosphoenolpyruvate synthase [Mycobacterium kiyosense]GLB96057.1 phosphoenolpyruvate synthase [Mycobacterium kiyosense]GLC02121.1 phosphoenolpyruvate synthase [Mycobacterium kiyosense]
MLERLTAHTDAAVERLGGKAAGLVRLLAAGLTVPEAWVVPADISLDPAARESALADLDSWWAHVRADHPDAVWAVRSSAVAEDLDGASFAGIYETALGLASLEEIRRAIEKCWAANESTRADVYRAAHDCDAGGGIALVVQRMIQPTAAGVLLTANPRRPFADEIVIDSVWGLGEALVSGRVDPDSYVVERSTGRLRTRRIAAKRVELVYHKSLTERCVAPERQLESSLDEHDLAALYDCATVVIRAIGPRRDLEWAIEEGLVYVLQDRPITGLPSSTPDNVWSRKWGDEYKSEYALPLTADLTAGWMDIPMFIEMLLLQGRPDLAVREPFKLVNGYLYMDGSYVVRLAGSFPKSLRHKMFGDLFTPLWLDRIMAEPWRPGSTLAFALGPYRDRARGSAARNLRAMDRHCAQIDALIVPKLRQDYSALDLREWRRQVDEVETFAQDHFRIIRWGMGVHNSTMHRLLAGLLASQAGDEDGALYAALISGLPGTHTAKINTQLWELAALAREDGSLAAALCEQRSWSQLQRDFPQAPFCRRFADFLLAHGHRSSSREIASPRWHEQPDVVLGLIRAQLQPGAQSVDPRIAEQQAVARRVAAFNEVVTRLRRKPLGGLRARLFRSICARTQVFTVYRENQRYHLDYLHAQLRALVCEQARRLVERGLLGAVDDVFLLTGDEFWAALAGAADPIDYAALERRRSNYLTYRHRVPATYLFDDVETEGELCEGDSVAQASPGAITGLGVSRGSARGRTRCVEELADLGDVRPGEVLVAKTIDPGWTSVFPMLAGLITESGGMLSHGAILAREYHLPTVTAVPAATSTLPTGTLVDVDGTAGVVKVVDDATLQPPAAS